MGAPPLSSGARPPQVLLWVGAVLVVVAGAAALTTPGAAVSRGLLLVMAVAAAGASVIGARSGLRTTRETLAACAAGLAVVGTGALEPSAGPAPAAVLAAAFLAVGLLVPTTRTWTLAAWGSLQVTVLHLLPGVPPALRTEVLLGVALVGLLLTFADGRLVPRAALVTTAPWHVAGVVEGCLTAWTADAGQRWPAAALVAAAGAGLVVARLRPVLDQFLGPPRVVPVVAGMTTGVAVSGAAAALGPVGIATAGYAGLLAATLVPELLSGWRRGLVTPIAVAGGSAAAVLTLVELAVRAEWGALVVLLMLTALPTALVAVRRPDERPVALPTAIGCVAGAVLLALPDGYLSPVPAAVALTVLYAVAMASGSGLDSPSRRATARVAAVCSVAAVVLLRAHHESTALTLVLAAQGWCTLGWARRTRPPADQETTTRASWRAGAAQLVLAAWVAFAAAGHTVVEWYSLPAAVGLLIAAGPQLWRGASWPAWGPGLLVAAVPSAVLAVTTSDTTRAVAVLVLAAAVLVAGARTGVRAPLMVGAGTALALAAGLAVRALPWPLGTALIVGSVLLAVGMRREWRPVAGFGRRGADLR